MVRCHRQWRAAKVRCPCEPPSLLKDSFAVYNVPGWHGFVGFFFFFQCFEYNIPLYSGLQGVC